MFPTNYANLLQGNSLRVVSNPHQQPMNLAQPARLPAPPKLQVKRPAANILQAVPANYHLTTSPQNSSWASNIQSRGQDFRIQPQLPYDQQQPQVGVTAWNLQHLANPNAFVPMQPVLHPVYFPTYQKLNYVY